MTWDCHKAHQSSGTGAVGFLWWQMTMCWVLHVHTLAFTTLGPWSGFSRVAGGSKTKNTEILGKVIWKWCYWRRIISFCCWWEPVIKRYFTSWSQVFTILLETDPVLVTSLQLVPIAQKNTGLTLSAINIQKLEPGYHLSDICAMFDSWDTTERHIETECTTSSPLVS